MTEDGQDTACVSENPDAEQAIEVDLPEGDFLNRWLTAWREADYEMGLAPVHPLAPERIGVAFLAFLRQVSRFGLFELGPITLRVDMVEDAVRRSLAQGPTQSDGREHTRLLQLVRTEQQKSGKRQVEELHVLLAFMRIGFGIPHRVFGELGVTPEQIEQFVRTGGSQPEAAPEPMYTPEEAAAYLKVHVETIREWIRSGRLRAGRLAGQRALRIRASDLMNVWEPLDTSDSEGT